MNSMVLLVVGVVWADLEVFWVFYHNSLRMYKSTPFLEIREVVNILAVEVEDKDSDCKLKFKVEERIIKRLELV